jgi:phosphocarrier protein HPr
MIAALPASQHG